jgi:fructose-1,6-bisphosphatase I
LASSPSAPARPSLNYHLRTQAKVRDDLRHLILDIARAATYISYAIQTTETGLTGSTNQFGEEQQALDVLSDTIIAQHLRESHAVNSYVSEERPDVVLIDPDRPYAVVFDPLDGSSLIEANFSIGSIFGIYEGSTIIGRKLSEQVAALYVLYGPRTILTYATQEGVHSFILNDVGEFILLRSHLGIGDTAKNYSPGNLGAIHDNAGYRQALDRWLDEKLTLRYSGCMVADVHHILAKGQGVFSNVGGAKYPNGKLRLVFECGPLSYIIERAGGASSDGQGAISDRTIEGIDQRSPIICGSQQEVAAVAALL